MTISINSQFDAGNIEVVSADSPENIRLKIRKDHQSEFLQWFYFRASGVRNQTCTFVIENASETTYPAGWDNYHVATSVDLDNWTRTPSSYDKRALSWTVTPDTDVIYFAYFAPYSLDRHGQLIAASADSELVSVETLGNTLDGRELDYVRLSANHPGSDSQALPQVWAIARQHPGESMASWWMEGWLERLLDENDATSQALISMADIHVVPNMNPDGSFRGHLRTNASGANLNREWADPSMERSPEVYLVQERMRQTGVSLCIDVHGDEALPYNFIAGTEGVTNWSEARDEQLIAFKRTLAALNPDFQTEVGYPRNTPNNANLTFCSNSIAQTYGCPAYTLEMPFKDTANNPMPEFGWSPDRSIALGRSFVDAVYLALCNRLL